MPKPDKPDLQGVAKGPAGVRRAFGHEEWRDGRWQLELPALAGQRLGPAESEQVVAWSAALAPLCTASEAAAV